MKKNFLLVIFLVGSLVFAQDIDDDFDAIFENAGDITAEENDKINSQDLLQEMFFPILQSLSFTVTIKAKWGLSTVIDLETLKKNILIKVKLK